LNGGCVIVSSDEEPRDPARHYDRVVGAWGHLLGEDLHYGYFNGDGLDLAGATDALTDEMLALAALSPGERGPDIGCGTGRAACRSAAEFDCEVLGISPSEVCVEDSGERARSLGLESIVRFVPGDGAALAFADGGFDCAWILESSHLVSSKRDLLAEAARVLKGGGRLVLCDIMLERKLSMEEVIGFRDEFLLLRDVFGRAVMEPRAFYTRAMEANGLSVTHSRDISDETSPTFRHWRGKARCNREKVVSLIGAEAWRRFVDACDILEMFWSRDILGYGIVAACRT